MPTPRVLIGSPVRQAADILNPFLTSLERIDAKRHSADFLFIDDNESPEASLELAAFQSRTMGRRSVLIWPSQEPSVPYRCNEVTHEWNETLVWRVAAMKDRIITHAKTHDYDYLFLIDSDVLVSPDTIDRLLTAEKDIICNIFWTSWQPGTIEMPQVWLQDVYSLVQKGRSESLSDEEANRRLHSFLQQLREPGIYEVGGLGACTLISRQAIRAGVRFAEIRNVSFWGEDRHFCIRAAALGFPLFVDTRRPAYHIYRPSNLQGVDAYLHATSQHYAEGGEHGPN